MKIDGDIFIPKGSYHGSGEAVLFIRKSDDSICDKVMYLNDNNGKYDLNTDETHYILKAFISSWEAVIPSLNIVYKLIES